MGKKKEVKEVKVNQDGMPKKLRGIKEGTKVRVHQWREDGIKKKNKTKFTAVAKDTPYWDDTTQRFRIDYQLMGCPEHNAWYNFTTKTWEDGEL